MKTTSIYKQFAQKLIYATTTFIFILSFMFYGFTKATIYEDISENLLHDAKTIARARITYSSSSEDFRILVDEGTHIDIVKVKKGPQKASFLKYMYKGDHYMQILFPIDDGTQEYVKITKNINTAHIMLNKIFSNLLILGIGGFIMIILYALAMSKTLLNPIIKLTYKLTNMNENSLTQIETKKLPIEFIPLANSINTLTTRIESYVKYQKELFIGAAHELKTPLAVMKLKAQVTLARPREPEKYVEVLKLHLNEIDGMNNMISSILDMGRQEGAQFEKPIEIDIIQYLESKIQNFRLIAKEKNITLTFIKDIEHFFLLLQPTLLTQIIQNFVQNAIKFTPNDKEIIIKATTTKNSIKIEVIDEGIGIDESIDLFAPFKRVGKEQGAGLGLFLAKSAVDTLGGTISLKNRIDEKSGTIATLTLQTNPTCKI